MVAGLDYRAGGGPGHAGPGPEAALPKLHVQRQGGGGDDADVYDGDGRFRLRADGDAKAEAEKKEEPQRDCHRPFFSLMFRLMFMEKIKIVTFIKYISH